MKIKVNKSEFIKKIDNVIKAVNSNSILPSLQGILITTNESRIEILGSNGNLSIKEEIPTSETTKVITPGRILVPGRLFREVISKQDSNINVEVQDSKMIIESEGAKTKINLMDESEYPIISFETIGKKISIEADKLRQLIKNVSFAAATEDKRIILNGVNLKVEKNKLTATATNSFRLAKETIDIDSDVEFNITIISKNLKDFLPTNAKGLIIIDVDDSKIMTKFNSTTISSKIIDGVYPMVDKLIPIEFENKLKIDKKELESVIDRTIVVSDETKKVIKFVITNDKLTSESKRSEIGVSNIETNKISYQGKPEFSIAFNAKFLGEAINKFDGEITINFNSDQKPFVIKGNSNNKLTQLILPHRTF